MEKKKSLLTSRNVSKPAFFLWRIALSYFSPNRCTIHVKSRNRGELSRYRDIERSRRASPAGDYLQDGGVCQRYTVALTARRTFAGYVYRVKYVSNRFVCGSFVRRSTRSRLPRVSRNNKSDSSSVRGTA